MSLGDFLNDTSLGSWADELEDVPVAPSAGTRMRSQDADRLTGSTRSEPRHYQTERREAPFPRDHDAEPRIPRAAVPLPTQPPFTAHIGNLAFDLTDSEIERYFEGCKIASIRIMKDRIDNRPKGFGYIEFSDLESLKHALSLADGQLAGRNIRVSVAEPPKSGPHAVDESAQGEWRTGRVLTTSESRPRTGEWERGNRQLNNDIGRGERARDINLASSESGVDKWERKGPLPALESSDRRQRAPGMGSRSSSGQFGSAPNRPSQHESPADANEWRSAKPLALLPSSDSNTPPPVSPSLKTTPVAQRKKLALLPRSEHPQEPPSTLQSITDESPSTRTNPFGAARPVDTDSALKKVEEKLAREKIKEHKEDSAPSKRTTSPTAPASASTGPRHEKPRSHPKQLLRRAPHNSSAAPNSTPSSTEVGDIATQKQEGQRSETASESTGGSWRKKADVEMVSSPPEEPGWETVPARGKKVNGVAVKH